MHQNGNSESPEGRQNDDDQPHDSLVEENNADTLRNRNSPGLAGLQNSNGPQLNAQQHRPQTYRNSTSPTNPGAAAPQQYPMTSRWDPALGLSVRSAQRAGAAPPSYTSAGPASTIQGYSSAHVTILPHGANGVYCQPASNGTTAHVAPQFAEFSGYQYGRTQQEPPRPDAAPRVSKGAPPSGIKGETYSSSHPPGTERVPHDGRRLNMGDTVRVPVMPFRRRALSPRDVGVVAHKGYVEADKHHAYNSDDGGESSSENSGYDERYQAHERGGSTCVQHSEVGMLRYLSQARETIDQTKDKVLDWIAPPDWEYTMEMPPCPPCEVLCGCAGPTEIHHIQDITCDCCGGPGGVCAACGCYVRRCPTCGQPFKPRGAICPLLASTCQRPTRPVPPPELVVTSIGPFRDKRYVAVPSRLCASSQALSDMLCDAANDYGYLLGSRFSRCCGRKDPPPAPVPGRPVQRLAPSFFPDVPEPRGPKFPWCCKRVPPPQPPRGGFIGALEDVAIIGVGLATSAVESAGEILDQMSGISPGCSSSRRHHCNCAPPPQRYPTKHNVYDDPPDAPTRSTGCRPLDALNNFMDAVTFPPHPDAGKLIPEAEIPETEETGNRVVDGINSMLDRLMPPPPKRELRSLPQNPITALVTYLADKPRPLPRKPNLAECLLPCFFPEEDGSGLRCVDKYLPDICFGEGLPECKSDKGRVDYVQFNLMPSSTSGTLPPRRQLCASLPCGDHSREPVAYAVPQPVVTPVALEQRTA